MVISGPLYRILNMEQANTDRPKARSTRKGKPPETSSEDSYNAQRGKPHAQSVDTSTALQAELHHTGPSPLGFTEQHWVQYPTSKTKGGTGMTIE